MPRNTEGIYTLPLPPVVSGQTVEANWANQTLADLQQAMTDSLSRSDQGSMQTALKLTNGTKAAPALSFASEANSGLWKPDAGDLHFAVLGVDWFRITNENGAQVSDDDGATWHDIPIASEYELYVDEREVTDVTWASGTNTLTLVKTVGNETVVIDDFDAPVTFTDLRMLDLRSNGLIKHASQVFAAGAVVTFQTLSSSRWTFTHDGTSTLNFQAPTGADPYIGENYEVEGTVLITNGAAPGTVTLQINGVNVTPASVLGSASAVASAKQLLSYVIHRSAGDNYNALFIWSAVTS